MKHLIFFFLLVCLATVIAPQARAQGGVSGRVSFVILDTTAVDTTVGTKICFTLVVKDSAGNIITDWNTQGHPTSISTQNSTANTDTSAHSWNGDSLGFTFATILVNGVPIPQISPGDWSLSEKLFVSGEVTICFINTKAETDVSLQITPYFPGLLQTSGKISFTAGEITNYLLDITPQTTAGNQVYHFRLYELVVWPRDRYLNPSNMIVGTHFAARFPGEFSTSIPGTSSIFSGTVFIQGPGIYYLTSTKVRELPGDTLQALTAYATNNNQIKGETTPFEVLSHEPYPFALHYPSHDTALVIDSFKQRVTFLWEQPNPSDPYTNIQISRFNSAMIGNDVVTYTWAITDSTSLAFVQLFEADNAGLHPVLTVTKGQLSAMIKELGGSEQWVRFAAYWYAAATDGLYMTKSTPPNNDPLGRPGYKIVFINGTVGIESVSSYAEAFTLNQNYPNPFNPSTTIEFSVPQPTYTTLKVYDVVGNEIETLVKEEVSPGTYKTEFNAAALPSGVYIYKLTAGDKTLTKRMVIAK